jgi:hypothetical protein
MKKTVMIVLSAVIALGLIAVASADLKSKMELKSGDEVYACNCGEACKCDTMSNNAGKCSCGKDMVKAQVTKAEEGKASLKAAGWGKERTFKTTGQYACACGPTCKCNTISQNPGKCTCGTEMSKIK